MKRTLGKESNQGAGNELLRGNWRNLLDVRWHSKALSWVELFFLRHNHSYKAREGAGQPGRHSMSGSGKKKSTAGSPVGTNWNWTQLEVMLHAFRMPPWNRFLLYLCNKVLEVKVKSLQLCGHVTMPLWNHSVRAGDISAGGVLKVAPEDLWIPWIVGKCCTHKYFPEGWLLALIKLSVRFINQEKFRAVILFHLSPTMSPMKNLRLRGPKWHILDDADKGWKGREPKVKLRVTH